MSDKQLVLSLFADQPAALAAATSLKDSGEISGDAIGILVLEERGNLDVDKVGARSWAAGAGVGACLLVLGPAVLGVGIVRGTLHHKGLKLDDQDTLMIMSALSGGKAAGGVLALEGRGLRGQGGPHGSRRSDVRPRGRGRGRAAVGCRGTRGLNETVRRASPRVPADGLIRRGSPPSDAGRRARGPR